MELILNTRINLKIGNTFVGAGLDTLSVPYGAASFNPQTGAFTLNYPVNMPYDTATNTFTAGNAGVTPLLVRGAPQQTASLFRVEDAGQVDAINVLANRTVQIRGPLRVLEGNMYLGEVQLGQASAGQAALYGSLAVQGSAIVRGGNLTIEKADGYRAKLNFPNAAGGNDPAYIEHYEYQNASDMRISVGDDIGGGVGVEDSLTIGASPAGVFSGVFRFSTNGRLNFLAGGAEDGTNLYRAGATTLRTDANMQVGATLSVGGMVTLWGGAAVVNGKGVFFNSLAGKNAAFVAQTDNKFVWLIPSSTATPHALMSVGMDQASPAVTWNLAHNFTTTPTVGGIPVTLSNHLHADSYVARAPISTGAAVALDQRSVTPAQLSNDVQGYGRYRFGELDEGAGGRWADVIDLSTYSHPTGGKINALYVAKTEHRIYHKQGEFGGSSWAVRALAYADETPLLSGATFTGAVSVPDVAAGNVSGQVANTRFVRGELDRLLNGAPGALDTLNELAQALGNDPNFAATMQAQLGNKANKAGDTFTGGVRIANGADLTLQASSGSTDAGDVVFTQGDGVELGRIYTSPGVLSISANSVPTPTLQVFADRVRVNGLSSDYGLTVGGGVLTDGWFRSRGNTGWFSETYGGGWYMTDPTWLRVYSGKNVYADTGVIRSDNALQVGGGGSIFKATASTGEVAVNTDALYVNSRHVGLGVSSVPNPEGWDRVLHMQSTSSLRLRMMTTNIDAGEFVHETGFAGSLPGMVTGTRSSHALTLMTGSSPRMTVTTTGAVGIGTSNPGATLHVAGTGLFNNTVQSASGAAVAMFLGRQVGAGYDQNSAAIFRAESDNTTSVTNMAFEALRGGVRTYSVSTAGVVAAQAVSAPSVTATSVLKVGPYQWQYNATTGSLDLVKS